MAKQTLEGEFGSLPTGQVDQVVAESFSQYKLAPVQDFVPLLATREAREHLRAATGEMPPQNVG